MRDQGAFWVKTNPTGKERQTKPSLATETERRCAQRCSSHRNLYLFLRKKGWKIDEAVLGRAGGGGDHV